MVNTPTLAVDTADISAPIAAPLEVSHLPLCVDLDGTLIDADTLVEGFAALWRHAPLRAIGALTQLRNGRIALKQALASEPTLNPETLPYNTEVLAYLRQEKAAGRQLILVTAAHHEWAHAIAAHLGLFDDVIATHDSVNLKGAAKAEALIDRFGVGGYVYIGDSRSDLEVWRHAAASLLVQPSPRLLRGAERISHVQRTFDGRVPRAQSLLRALRMYQWVKNLLVFVPLFAAQALDDRLLLFNAAIMFVAFSLAASGGYLINDFQDVEADRRHPRKRNRPFASGALPIQYALLGPLLIAIGLAVAAWLSVAAAAVLGVYVLATAAYSQWLKRKPLADVFVLAALYTVRVAGGAVACGIALSSWLLAFCAFLFLGLATIKRSAELYDAAAAETIGHRRGYQREDLALVQTIGVVSSFMATLVLALYIDLGLPPAAYAHPEWLWLTVPVMLYWQCRLWLSTSRGRMHDDPIVFAARDSISWLCFAAICAALLAATAGTAERIGGL